MALFSGITASELDETRRYNPRTGEIRIRHWKGTPLEIAAIETQAKNLKYSYTTGWDGAYKTVSVEYPETEENEPNTPLSEKWECDANLLQKDIWSLPAVQAELQKIGGTIIGQSALTQHGATEAADVRATFRNDFDAIANGREVRVQRIDATGALVEGEETTVTLAMLLDIARIYGANRQVFLDLAMDISKGVSFYNVIQYVARHTKVTNQSSSIKAARENVGRMFTATTITALFPQDVKFEAPTDGYWLKQVPTVDQIEKGKWEIVQEYWHADDYSRLIYGAPVA